MSDWRDAEAVCGLLRDAARRMVDSPLRHGSCVRLPARGSMLATGDIHDNPEHLRVILSLARLDESPDHHVVLHELIHGARLVNGVDLSYRMLCRVAEAVLAHPAQVHPMLANHELAQAFRQPVSKGAGDQVEQFDAGLEFVFGDDADEVALAVGEFIRAMPLAVRGGQGLFLSHSLPSASAPIDPEVLDRPLADEDFAPRTGAAWRLVWGRGLDAARADALAEEWGVRLFVVGHAHVEFGIEARGDRLLVLNSDHERACAVRIGLSEPLPPAGMLMQEALPLGAFGCSHG